MVLPAKLTWRLGAILLVVVATVALLVAVKGCGSDDKPKQLSVQTIPRLNPNAPAFTDPFSYAPSANADFEKRAAKGFAHVLYANAPGGAEATAQRVARYRSLIDQTAKQAKVPADLLEALVYLESGGYPEVSAGGSKSLSGAVGLTQILAETGRNLLGMQVDVGRSEYLTRRIIRDTRRGRTKQVKKEQAERRKVDARFDPPKSIAATGRYLIFAKSKLGNRIDLAFASYHMGVGNLLSVLKLYNGGKPVPYPQLYFDSSPLRNQATWNKLAGFGDESSSYYFKLLAAEQIMRLYRTDRPTLERMQDAQLSKNSAEEVLRPGGDTVQFDKPSTLISAWNDHDIIGLPNQPAQTGFAIDPSMGELANLVHQKAGLYRGLRPSALAVLLAIGAEVHAISGAKDLTVTSTVRDVDYQGKLIERNIQATRNYSLHTTGYAFDISRTYTSRQQALAFQFVLDRLTALNVIAWVREPEAIHVAVGPDGDRYKGLLDRIDTRP